MKLSVIIPTFNRAETLKTCLTRLLAQEGADFEVIVVDDGSQDNTAEVVSAFIKSPAVHPNVTLTYLKQPNLRQAAARNNGVRHAIGDILIFIGDDIFVEPGWLKEHADFHAAHPEKEAMAVGHMTWASDPSPTRFMKWLEKTGLMPNYRKLKNHQKTDYWHFYTGNVSLKRAWFDSHQFDEHFKAYGWEDTKFGCELMKNGAHLYYLKHAVGFHFHPLSEADYFPERMREIGKSAALFVEDYPEVPLIPTGLKRVIFSVLASRPVAAIAGILKKEWGWYCLSKRYFLQGAGKPKKLKTYCIIGSYGSSNIGDELMLEMILKHLPKGSKKFVLSGHPKDTLRRHPEITAISGHLPFGLRSFFRFQWLRSLRLIGLSNEVLLGGGGLFVDDYRKRAIPLWTWHVLWCRLQGKRPVLFANSVGPLNTLLGRWLTKWALKRCKLIIVRDADSQKLVRQLLPKGKVILGADLAFLCSPPKPKSRQKLLALNLRDWKMNLEGLKNFVMAARRQGYALLPIAMEHKDREILSKVVDLVEVRTPQNFGELCGLLTECEYAIGMRLHFLVAAVISGCRVGAIAYSNKVTSIMKELYLPYVTPASLSEKTLTDLMRRTKLSSNFSEQKKRAAQMFNMIK